MGGISITFAWLAFVLLSFVPSSNSSLFDKALERNIDAVFRGGKPGKFLQTVAKDLELAEIVHDPSIALAWGEPKISAFCSTCTILMNRLLDSIASNKTVTEISDHIINMCLSLHIGNDVACEGLVHSWEPDLIYILTNTEGLTGNDLCGTMTAFGCISHNPDRVYNITLPDTPKPPISEPQLPQIGAVPTLKILHLADTHIDPEYLPGSNAECPERTLCCRASSGEPEGPEYEAGYWGDYRSCDPPIWMVDDMFEHIAVTHTDIDLIIWTGDIIPHDLWATSKESNLEYIHSTADMVKVHFPGIPVFPAVGNHEGHPADSFPQPYITEPEFNISWLYDELVSIWSYWLPVETATSIAYGGYYSTLIRPGLRIISINTQYCYAYNWWLVLDSHDVAEELANLAVELQKAEDAGEVVYIIGHIPPGNSDCHYTWSHEYNKIITRYEDTVVGLFYGHTHRDHYHVFFESGTNRPHDVGYIAQSQTPYSNLNPGYKIYSVEGDFVGSKYRVLDHDNYIFDLDEANNANYTTYFKLYSAMEEYGLPDLSPQSWTDLVYLMAEPNSTLFDSFYRNFVKAGRPSIEKGCDDKCKSRLLCRLLRADSSDESHCVGL